MSPKYKTIYRCFFQNSVTLWCSGQLIYINYLNGKYGDDFTDVWSETIML
jgi:hypothetical protein